MRPSSRQEAETILSQVYRENPRLWPAGVSVGMFDGGCYLIREKRAGTAVGVVGFQKRSEYLPSGIPQTIGYYSIAVLPEHRRQGYAKEAVAKVLREKSGTVDQIRALIVAGNSPSIALAERLQVPAIIKAAAFPTATNVWSPPLEAYQVPPPNPKLNPEQQAAQTAWHENRILQQNRTLPLPKAYSLPHMFQGLWGRRPNQELQAELAGSKGQGVYNRFRTQGLPGVQLFEPDPEK